MNIPINKVYMAHLYRSTCAHGIVCPVKRTVTIKARLRAETIYWSDLAILCALPTGACARNTVTGSKARDTRGRRLSRH